MSKVQTPLTFAKKFTAGFAPAVRQAAGTDARLSTREAAKVAEPFRDNAMNFLARTGQKSVAVDKLIGSAFNYALATASKAAGADGKLSSLDIRSLPLDLQFEARKGDARAPNARAAEFKTLAASLSLSFFGEDDSGDFVASVRRKGPVAELTAETFLDAFGFSRAKQEGSDQFSFAPMRAAQWDELVDAQPDEGKAAMQRVRDVMEPLGGFVAFVEDNTPFGAPVFLIARGAEGELFGLRATVGGMGF